jgi:multiple antibiotic resistance protein
VPAIRSLIDPASRGDGAAPLAISARRTQAGTPTRREDAMTFDQLANAFVTLLVIVEPVAVVPLFLGLTEGFDAAQRRQAALRAAALAFAILAGSALIGEWLLAKLGITLPAFRVAGGLLLFSIAFEMVFARRTERKYGTMSEALARDRIRNIAAFPLAIPLLAGPGAITATMLLAGQTGGDPARLAALIAIVAAVMAIAFLCLALAHRLAGLIGVTGNAVLSRLLGVMLAALAVQFVADGVAQLVVATRGA